MTDTDLITAEGSIDQSALPTDVSSDIAAPPSGGSLGAMVLPELRALATKVGVKGVSGMRKGELIEAIRERQSGGGTPDNRAEQRNGTPAEEPADRTADQAETDRYWNAIIGNGGRESACGWCKDKWGISWQITPTALMDAISDADPAAARRAFDAMMEMTRIDIAAIEAARRG